MPATPAKGVPAARERHRLPRDLRRAVRRSFAPAAAAEALIGELLTRPEYDRAFVRRLLRVARGEHSEPWELRQLAALALEHQLLQLAPGDTEELDLVLAELDLLAGDRARTTLVRDVLRQGFSTRDRRAFAVELRRRLARNLRAHRALAGPRPSASALAAWIHLSRRDCRLHLAPHLFTPGEVVDRIVAASRSAAASPSPYVDGNAFSRAEARRAVDRLPADEKAVVEELVRRRVAYWVAAETPAEINSLVEYPLTTVVLVVKLPGSRTELELKRAGKRSGLWRDAPLGVIFERYGQPVPKSHRLDGGSFGYHLEWESQAAARMAILYRRTHGEEAPLPTVIALSTVEAIPFRDQSLAPREYFTSPQVFGESYGAMRSALERSVAAFYRDNPPPSPDDDATDRFLGYVRLTQSLVLGTSSFRLDKLSQYLSGEGAEIYFRRGLGRDYSQGEACRFADELLEEILPRYLPPAGDSSFADYLAAAFAQPQNRATADDCYRALVRRVGRFWGTLLAVGCGSSGECFVPRNVGLRTVWQDGDWRIAIVFLDHDALRTATATLEDFWPENEMLPIVRDDYFICGGDDTVGALEALATIYRAAPATVAAAQALFRHSLKRAFDATRMLLEEGGRLDDLFHPSYQRKLREWHELVRLSLSRGGEAGGWKAFGEGLLRASGWYEKLIAQAITAAEQHAEFFAKYAFLYRGPQSVDGIET